MDFEVEDLKTQTNRTFIEQKHIQKLIQQFYDDYYLCCIREVSLNKKKESEKVEKIITSDDDEDYEYVSPDELYRESHAQYLYSSLISIGNYLVYYIYYGSYF